jgi:hypothetical protein
MCTLFYTESGLDHEISKTRRKARSLVVFRIVLGLGLDHQDLIRL